MHASLHRFSAALASFYVRLTHTRYAAIFFALAVLHFAVLVLLQALAFGANVQTSSFFANIITGAGARSNELTFVYGGALRTCAGVPHGDQGGYTCRIAWPLDAAQAGGIANVSSFPPFTLDRRANVTTSSEVSDAINPAVLSEQCTDVLLYPAQLLLAASRTNIAFIAFDCWIFGTSILALLSESIPHLVLSLASLALSTAYSLWNVQETSVVHANFNEMVSGPRGACGDIGANLVPEFWRLRMACEIGMAVVNFGCLLGGGLAGWRLIQRYSLQTFQSVGAAPRMHRMHKVLLGFSTLLRLYLFFATLSMSLWVDILRTGPAREFIVQGKYISYLTICSVVLALLPAWVFIGERAMRRESRRLAIVFAVGGTQLLVCHVTLFASSTVYRLMAFLWPFFTIVAVTSSVLITATLALAICCRHNFGAGLAHYLSVMRTLEADGFTRAYMPAVDEKLTHYAPSTCERSTISSFGGASPDVIGNRI